MNLMDLTAALKMDVSDFLRGKDQAKSGMGELSGAATDTAQKIALSAAQIDDVNKAFQELGIKSSAELKTLAQDAFNAFQTIKESGIASAGDIRSAEEAATSARVAYEKSVGDAVVDASGKFRDQQKAIEDLGGKITTLGGMLSATLTAPLLAVGAAGLAAGVTLDDAFDNIVIKTGAVGSNLASLQDSFRTVFSGVASSAADVSTAIATLTARTGETGPALEDLSTQVLTLSRLTGESLKPLIDGVSRAFQNWTVATKDQHGTMNVLLEVAQRTQIPVTQLVDTLTRSGPVLRELGLSFEQSAAMIGLFEKAGINAAGTLTALKTGLGNIVKAGQEPAEAFRELITTIKNTDSEAAIFYARQVVGAKGAADFANAIRSGKVDFDSFAESLGKGGDLIANTAKRTDDFAQSWVTFKNNLTLALEPLGKDLFDILNSLADQLPKITGMAKAMTDGWVDLGELKTPFVALATVLGVGGPVLVAVGAFISKLPEMKAALDAVNLSFMGLAKGAVIAAGAIAAFEIAKALYDWSKASGQLGDAVQQNYTDVSKLEQMAAKLGITVDRGNRSITEYANALILAIRNSADYQGKLAAVQEETEKKAESETKAKQATEDHARQMMNAALAAKAHEEAIKAQKLALENLKETYAKVYEQFTKGLATEEQLAAAQTKLQEALDKVHPEKVAERQAKGHEEMMKRYADELKWIEELPAREQKIADERFKIQEKLNIDLGKANAAMHASATGQVTIGGGDQELKDLQKSLADRTAEYFKYNQLVNDFIRDNRDVNDAETAEMRDAVVQDLADMKEAWQQYKEEVGGAIDELTAKQNKDGMAGRLPDEVRAAIQAAAQIKEAYKTLGSESTAAIGEQADRSLEAYGRITQSGTASAHDILLAERNALRDHIAEANAAGETISETDKAHLAKLEEQLKGSLGKQKGAWNTYVNEIGSILGGIGKNIGAGLWDLISGKTNNDLDKQQSELQASLAERKQEWANYQADVAAKIQEVTDSHAAHLAQELADLQANLDDKRADWEQYQIDVAAHLDDFKAKQDESLAAELASLQANLNDKREAYEAYRADVLAKLDDFKAKEDQQLEDTAASLMRSLEERKAAYDDFRNTQIAHLSDFRQAQDDKLNDERASLLKSLADKRDDYTAYVADVNEKLSTLREASAEKLQKELENLHKGFEEKQKAYEQYVLDVNHKLNRIGEDLAESVDDQTRQTNRGVDDKKRAFARDEQDTKEKIERELAKGKDANRQQIRDWQEALDRKREDLDIYVQRAAEDLVEFTDDHKREADRQVADLQASLAERTAAFTEYQHDYTAKVGEVTTAAATELTKQETALNTSLTKRTTDWETFQAGIATKLTNAQGVHDSAIAAEEKKVSDSLTARDAEWVKFQASVAAKLVTAQQKHDEEIAAEETKVAASLAAREAEWIKYQASIAAKIGSNQQKHDDAIDAEVAKVAAGLAAKEKEWDKYQESIAKKMDQASEKEAQQQTKELNDLKKGLNEKQTEYDKHYTEVSNKIAILQEKHITFWSTISGAATTALGKIAEATLALPFEMIFDKLKKKVMEDVLPAVYDAFKGVFGADGSLWETLKNSKLGEALYDIGTAIWDGLKAVGQYIWDALKGIYDSVKSIFKVVEDTTQAIAPIAAPAANAATTAGTGAGAAASSAISGWVGAIAGVATAISSIIGNFQMAKMETTLNAIEDSTRYAKSYLRDNLVPMAQMWWPKLDRDHFDYDVLIPTLQDIPKEVIDKGILVANAINEAKNVLIDAKDNTHEIVTRLDTSIDRFNDISTWLGKMYDTLTGIKTSADAIDQGMDKFDVTSLTTAVQNIAPNLSGSFSTLQTSISGIGSSFSTALSNQFAQLPNQFNSIVSAIGQLDDPGSVLYNGFNSLSSLSYLSQLPQALSNLGSGARNNISNFYYNTNINGISVPSTQIASTLRSYGVPF